MYPAPADLIRIYDTTVPRVRLSLAQPVPMRLLTFSSQNILDILAEMVAYDSTLDIRPAPAGQGAGAAGINLGDMPSVGLD